MGRLCLGVVTGTNSIGKRVEGTNTFFVINFEEIQKYRLNKIFYTSVVCELRLRKKDPNRTRITTCGTNVCYPGDVGTNTYSLELFKLIINSVLSISKHTYLAPALDNTLLIISLNSSSEYVFVPTSPG